MKKIGILFGMENTFPQAFIDEINRRGEIDIVAEFIKIDKLSQASDSGYAVIFDRISHDVPFYRAYLKNASLMGTAVINNPFWWSADEKFFNNCLAVKLGVPVPKTYLLPSNERPSDTSESSFRNMVMPLDWEKMFEDIGFPAYMKPHAGGGWKSVYKVTSPEDFYQKHQETGQLVMLLQEEIKYEEYYRVYCIGGKYVKIMPYAPHHEPHLRYQVDTPPSSQELLNQIEEYTLTLCRGLGYDFNTVEFAVRDGIPYAIDFCNPAPDADRNSVGEENFQWVVKTTADFAIEKAKSHVPGDDNLTWGSYIHSAVSGSLKNITNQPSANSVKQIVQKAAPKKKAAKKPAAKKADSKK